MMATTMSSSISVKPRDLAARNGALAWWVTWRLLAFSRVRSAGKGAERVPRPDARPAGDLRDARAGCPCAPVVPPRWAAAGGAQR